MDLLIQVIAVNEGGFSSAVFGSQADYSYDGKHTPVPVTMIGNGPLHYPVPGSTQVWTVSNDDLIINKVIKGVARTKL